MNGTGKPGPYDAGIYFLWRKGDLVYVGKSRQVQERIAQLSRDATYARLVDTPRPRPFDCYTCLVVDEPMEKLGPILKDLERAYIAHHGPLYNHLDQNGGT
jgi:excinuclease UvrABC nuclease subunit